MVQKMRGYRDLCSKLCNEIYECKALICGHKLTRGAKVGHFTRLNITFCFRSDGSQVKRLGVIATEFRERACIVEIGYKGRQIYVVHVLRAPEVCQGFFGIVSSWKAKRCNFAICGFRAKGQEKRWRQQTRTLGVFLLICFTIIKWNIKCSFNRCIEINGIRHI